MKQVIAIQDLQFGSTGKGLVAGTIAHGSRADTVATAWGPNAGHTFEMGGRRYVSTMLASSAVAPTVKTILIGPGSVVNTQKLFTEIVDASDQLRGKRLIIHPNAALLMPEHAERERSLVRIGSTMKGTAEAAIDKMRRLDHAVVGAAPNLIVQALQEAAANLKVIVSEREYNAAIQDSERLVLEGAQGFSLGIHTQFYPHTTSRDVSTAQLLADCRVPIPSRTSEELIVVGVCRTYPIRVANRYDSDGTMIGTSGGCYEDQHELSWKRDLNREPELTTVTKLPRRVFSFSYDQIRAAAQVMRPTMIALTFCDYIAEYMRDVTAGDGSKEVPTSVQARIDSIEKATGVQIAVLSFGPGMEDVMEVGTDGSMMRPLLGSASTKDGIWR